LFLLQPFICGHKKRESDPSKLTHIVPVGVAEPVRPGRKNLNKKSEKFELQS
jgi:hypothetical protein